MRRRIWLIMLLGGLTLVLLAAVACGEDLTPLEQRVGQLENQVDEMAPDPSVRVFYLTGVEWKGTTSVTDLDAPAVDPVSLSAGYGYKEPGVLDSSNPDKWRVATYVFTPGTITVYEGDTVELTTFIVNGNYHFTRLVAPDGTEVDAIEMNRGREYKLSFVADQAGTYQLICDTHAPTMRAYITAVPRKLSYLGSESFCEGCVA